VGRSSEIVTFLSDYGLEDEFVGVCHGVMLRIVPALTIVDVHHNILRQDIRHGAIVLQQSIKYLPDGVHLAVVDPAVGTKRRAIAIESKWGNIFVGPDNGLMVPAVELNGGVRRAFEITDERFMLTPVSHTFHGRDVFSPVAAHMAGGVDPSELGPPIESSQLVPLDIPEAWIHDDHLHAEVLQLDRFGNLQMNFSGDHLEQAGLSNGALLEIRLEGHRVKVPYRTSFADVAAGDFVLVEDSYKHLSLAVNKGDAAARLQAHAGSTIIVGPSN
jgi:S-adenosylmethionine hydrolase